MARKDYTRNGYNEYHIIEDFTANENWTRTASNRYS
jgi:hypothetical protein